MLNAFANALAGSSSAYNTAQNTTSSNNNKKSGSTNRDANGKPRPTATPSVLRADLYKSISEAERWLSTSTPGDGYSYRPTFEMVFPHYPELEVGVGCGATEEVAVLVGVVTDMALEIGFLGTHAVPSIRHEVD